VFSGWQKLLLSMLFFSLLCLPAYVRKSQLAYMKRFSCQVLAFAEIQSASFLFRNIFFLNKLWTKISALVRERTIPTERPPLVGEVVPTFADIGCRVVSATDSQSLISIF
jgi:hypothetical protein